MEHPLLSITVLNFLLDSLPLPSTLSGSPEPITTLIVLFSPGPINTPVNHVSVYPLIGSVHPTLHPWSPTETSQTS